MMFGMFIRYYTDIRQTIILFNYLAYIVLYKQLIRCVIHKFSMLKFNVPSGKAIEQYKRIEIEKERLNEKVTKKVFHNNNNKKNKYVVTFVQKTEF